MSIRILALPGIESEGGRRCPERQLAAGLAEQLLAKVCVYVRVHVCMSECVNVCLSII